MRERWRDMFLMEEQICFSSDGCLFTWWPRANKDFPDEWVGRAVGHNTPTPSYISQADGIRSDGCPKECGPRDTMLIPHKKRRKTRSSAIPNARSTAVHGSACCALIEAPTRVAPPLGGKNTTWGQKKVPASTLKKDLGKQKRKCCGKKVSFAPQKDIVGWPLDWIARPGNLMSFQWVRHICVLDSSWMLARKRQKVAKNVWQTSSCAKYPLFLLMSLWISCFGQLEKLS